LGGGSRDAVLGEASSAALIDFATNPGRYELDVVHLHGRATDDSDIVVTERDYQNLYVRDSLRQQAYREGLDLTFGGNPVLFVGLGLSEGDVMRPLREFVSDTSRRNRSIIALRHAAEASVRRDAYVMDVYSKYGVPVIHYGFRTGMTCCDQASKEEIDPSWLSSQDVNSHVTSDITRGDILGDVDDGANTLRGPAEKSPLFPRDFCIAAIAELSAWTSVQNILAAARHIESRPVPQDRLEPLLVVPFDDDAGKFRSIMALAIEWLAQGYRVPDAKIAIARAVDPKISDGTVARLLSLQFQPEIENRKPGALDQLPDKSCVLLKDDPVVIEMVQAPLICMISRLVDATNVAKSIADMLDHKQQETGGRGTIFHRPYADSRLPAVLEALCFFTYGLDFGPRWALAGKGDIDISYRAVNVLGVPPIDAQMLWVARKSMEVMLASLR
jgi:hypothetical protein